MIVADKLVYRKGAKTFVRAINRSGGAVAPGDVVILDTTNSTASALAFTTTVTQNDPLVLGMANQAIANLGEGEIQIEGPTKLLKVNGTTDIAKGDILTSFTTVKIAAKRSATTSAGMFAIALEAYATNDSLGVIDAWLFPASRVAGATSSWGDDTLLNLGTDNDIALVHRSTALNANTTLAGVVEGTPATLAVAANSLIIGNITDDGDIAVVVSKAGNSHTAFLADGSTGDTILNAATGQSVDLYVAGTKEYDFSATAVDLNGNHLDNAGYLILNAVTLPAATEVYIGQDNAGDCTINALTGKSVNMAVNGTDVATFAGAAITFSQAVSINADLTVTGSLTFGGNWTVGATLTVDELILDTDGVAPANTNCYAVRDNAGDLTVNAITAKQFIVAIAGTDEYTFSATILDMLDNALDNCGYVILNAATAPAGTEVYAVNDNTGDLTLNALSTKAVHIAIAGVDEVDFSATTCVFNEASNDRDFRIETADLAYAFYVDGGKNSIVLGANTDISSTDQMVRIGRAARTATANTAYADLWVERVAAVTIPAGTAAYAVAVNIEEPDITATGTVTVAATVRISGQPTEGTNNAGLWLVDVTDLAFGDSVDSIMRWSTADADNHALALGLGASLAFHLCAKGAIGVDWNVAAASNATLYIHGAATPATEYIAISTDETDAHLNAVGANWKFEIGGTAELTITAAAVNLAANTLQGGTVASGDMVLMSTSDATKGFITIAATAPGMVVGGTGASVDRATNDGTNAIHLFNGTAPVGAMTNGVSLYSSGGEFYAMDAAGNATLNSPHSEDGDYIVYSYSAVKDKTVVIHLEKMMRALAAKFPAEFAQFMAENAGLVHKGERASRGLARV